MLIELKGDSSLYNDLDSNTYNIYLTTIVTFDFIFTFLRADLNMDSIL